MESKESEDSKMKTIKMQIADLRHPEKNIRRHPEKQIKEMKRSLEKFGQFRPVVVDDQNIILAGNGLVTAMRQMGYTEADVLKYDNLSEKDKKKLMIADNQVASLGLDDYGAIEEIIRSLDGDVDIPGYDEDTLRMIVEEAESAVKETMSYGVYPASEVESLRREEQDRAENGFTPVEQTYTPEPVSVPQGGVQPVPYAPAPAEENEPGKVYAKPQETERYIICPHCGEKIYI